MSYVHFQVGEKFPLPIKAQGDGGLFQYDVNGAMFILKLSRTDLIAIEAFRTGKIEIALFSASDVLFFLYKIDGIANSWGDCPYAVQALPLNQRPNEKKAPEKILNLYLVDSRLDLLLAMRTAHLTDEFQNKLMQIVEKQANTSFNNGDYTTKVQQIWNTYTPDEMYTQAAVKQQVESEIPLATNNKQ